MQWDPQVWWWLAIFFLWSLSKELWYLLPGISPLKTPRRKSGEGFS